MNISAIPSFYDANTGKQVNAYSIFVRGKNKGKNIYYARLRNKNGEKLSVHISTQKTSYDEAEKWVINNYEKLIKDYEKSLINRNDKSVKELHSSLLEYFKHNSKWLLLDKQFGIKRLDRTNREYESLVKRHLITYLNENHLYKYSDITAKSLYEFQIDCISKKISNKSISDMLFILKLLYNRLMAQGTIEINPFAGIKQVKREKSKIKGMFDINSIKGIFNDIWENEIEYLFHLIAYMTGMRNSEIRLLKTSDFENMNGMWFINITNARDDNTGVKTENAIRKIALHDFVYQRVQDYIVKYNRTGYIFTDNNNQVFSASEVSNMIESVAKKIGVDMNYCKTNNITFHSWRHMFSTVLYKSGMISSDWIEYFMGHKQKGIKAIYTHLNTVDGKDACQKMLQVLEQKIL